MSLTTKPINDSVFSAREPMGPGNYYLVDCSEAIASYMEVPAPIRMQAIGEAADLSEYEIVDMELEQIFPVLTMKQYQSTLDYHSDWLLDEGIEQIIDECKSLGIYDPNTLYGNTKLQLGHVDALEQLGHDLFRVMREHGMYDRDGVLGFEYVGLLEQGLVVMRRAEYTLL